MIPGISSQYGEAIYDSDSLNKKRKPEKLSEKISSPDSSPEPASLEGRVKKQKTEETEKKPQTFIEAAVFSQTDDPEQNPFQTALLLDFLQNERLLDEETEAVTYSHPDTGCLLCLCRDLKDQGLLDSDRFLVAADLSDTASAAEAVVLMREADLLNETDVDALFGCPSLSNALQMMELLGKAGIPVKGNLDLIFCSGNTDEALQVLAILESHRCLTEEALELAVEHGDQSGLLKMMEFLDEKNCVDEGVFERAAFSDSVEDILEGLDKLKEAQHVGGAQILDVVEHDDPISAATAIVELEDIDWLEERVQEKILASEDPGYLFMGFELLHDADLLSSANQDLLLGHSNDADLISSLRVLQRARLANQRHFEKLAKLTEFEENSSDLFLLSSLLCFLESKNLVTEENVTLVLEHSSPKTLSHVLTSAFSFTKDFGTSDLQRVASYPNLQGLVAEGLDASQLCERLKG